jgi:hypothetical protein
MKTRIDTERAKKMVEKTASTTVKFTKTIVKVIFVLIILYTIIVSLYIFFTTYDRGTFLTNIATISVGGFWAFFLGYFGWRMGQTIEDYFSQIKKRNNKN